MKNRLFGRLVAYISALLIWGTAWGQVDHFKIEASGGGSIGKQRAGAPFGITISAQKADNSTDIAFTGKARITSTGKLTTGGDSTVDFTAGVLSSHDVAFGNTGTFTITASHDANGTSNPFTVAAFTSDDFDSYNLQTGTWVFSDSLGDATLTMPGTGTGNAHLSIAIPGSASHDLSTGNNTAPRILQPASNADFVIEVKFESALVLADQHQGVIVQQDIDHLMRFDFGSNGVNTRAFASTTTDGYATVPMSQIASTSITSNGAAALYMRVNRSADVWSMSYSTDGSAYTPIGSFSHTLAVTQVGLYVANGSLTPPGTTMLADYFFDSSDTVTPEDGVALTDTLPPLIYHLRSIAGSSTIQLDWKTDERSRSRIEYGTSIPYDSTLTDDTLRTAHSLTLRNLKSSTVYNLRVIGTDSLGNADTTANVKDTTGAPPLPVISGVLVETAATSAYVTWTTDVRTRGKVAYGLIAAYGDTAHVDALVDVLYTVTGVPITGLIPGRTYHFMAIATDSIGTIGTSTDGTFTTSGPATATTLESDEFNATTLNGRWTFVDPRVDASYATPDTVVQILVPSGIEHDVWLAGYHAPRIMQSANNTDFELVVKWNSAISPSTTGGWYNQGILAEQDANNVILFDYASSPDGTYIFGATFQNGFLWDSIKIRVYMPAVGATGTEPLYMRVRREGNVWSQWYSTDGSTWTRACTFHHTLTLAKVGLFGGNAGPTPPSNTVIVDYFRTDGVVVNLKAYLQGPYVAAGDTMKALPGASIPTKHPYGGAPWNYAGSDSVTSVPDGVVDWVLVELRSDTAASTAVDTLAGFLKQDGMVVGLDGTNPLQFPAVKSGSYYVVLRHRNHPAIMSAQALVLNGASTLYDFTTAQAQAYGTNAMVLVGTKYAMYAGDANRSGIITAADANYLFGFLNTTGYHNGDINFSGIVTAADANMLYGNLNKASHVPN